MVVRIIAMVLDGTTIGGNAVGTRDGLGATLGVRVTRTASCGVPRVEENVQLRSP